MSMSKLAVLVPPSNILNLLVRLTLEGGVLDGDEVKVRTLSEAQRLFLDNDLFFQNHFDLAHKDCEVWDDDEFLLKDGTHLLLNYIARSLIIKRPAA